MTSKVRTAVSGSLALRALTRAAARVLDAPIAILSLVEEGDQFFVATCGISSRGTPREYAFCSYAILASKPLEVKDAAVDERFADNPLVFGEPNIRYYLGLPISDSNGWPLGTLCVLDRKPRESATEKQLEILQDLAHAAEAVIATERELFRLSQSESVPAPTEDHSLHAALTGLPPGWESRLGPETRFAGVLDPVRETLRKSIGLITSIASKTGRKTLGATVVEELACVLMLVDTDGPLSAQKEAELAFLSDNGQADIEIRRHENGQLECRIWIELLAPLHLDEVTTPDELADQISSVAIVEPAS